MGHTECGDLKLSGNLNSKSGPLQAIKPLLLIIQNQ